MLCNLLRQYGLDHLQSFTDSRNALKYIENEKSPTLIISDWNMPHVSGIDILKKSRTFHPDVKFMMMTGRSDMDSIIEAKNAGVSGYIRKPFSPHQFKEKLEKILDQKLPD